MAFNAPYFGTLRHLLRQHHLLLLSSREDAIMMMTARDRAEGHGMPHAIPSTCNSIAIKIPTTLMTTTTTMMMGVPSLSLSLSSRFLHLLQQSSPSEVVNACRGEWEEGTALPLAVASGHVASSAPRPVRGPHWDRRLPTGSGGSGDRPRLHGDGVGGGSPPPWSPLTPRRHLILFQNSPPLFIS